MFKFSKLCFLYLKRKKDLIEIERKIEDIIKEPIKKVIDSEGKSIEDYNFNEKILFVVFKNAVIQNLLKEDKGLLFLYNERNYKSFVLNYLTYHNKGEKNKEIDQNSKEWIEVQVILIEETKEFLNDFLNKRDTEKSSLCLLNSFKDLNKIEQ